MFSFTSMLFYAVVFPKNYILEFQVLWYRPLCHIVLTV